MGGPKVELSRRFLFSGTQLVGSGKPLALPAQPSSQQATPLQCPRQPSVLPGGPASEVLDEPDCSAPGLCPGGHGWATRLHRGTT